MQKLKYRIIFFLFLSGCFRLSLQAQTLSGTVSDAETEAPLEAVMVSVLRDNALIDYVMTDAKGQYSLPWKHRGTLQVSFALLGYKRQSQAVSAAGVLNRSLYSEAILLKEVQIRPGRISSRKDTVRYNLADFASSQDVHIKDVLKKLPGIDVEESGQVKYKGKPIDHFLVEGMDVSGGRYNQINNNLNAKAVQSAEIMENYQPVKALKGKINSEAVALNLKLDPTARDQWIANGTLGGGLSLWEAALNALQLGKGNQSLYSYKSNNNGTDLSREQTLLANNASQEIPLCNFLEQPALSAPLDKERLLFNNTHTVNANRMYKWNDQQSLRLQAGYTHNQIRQQHENTLLYYRPDDTLRLDETYLYHLTSDAAHLEARYEDNNPQHYLANRFLAEGENNRGDSRELHQTIRTAQFTAQNFFNLIRNGEKSTGEFSSAVQYACQPSSLSLPDGRSGYWQQRLYTDNKVSYLRKYNGFTRRYSAGIEGEWGEVNHFSTSNFSIYLLPHFQLERDRWLCSLSLPLRFKHYPAQQYAFLLFSPTLYLRYQLDYHWRFSLYGSLNRSTGDATDLCPFVYQTDYRTLINRNGLFPTATRQDYNLYGEYKNTVHEFFVNATLAYQRTRNNTLNEQSISEDLLVYTRRRLTNHTGSWSLTGRLSKGFFDWHLKASLYAQLSRSNGQQLTEGAGIQSFRYDYLKVEPKLLWSPATAFDTEYHASLGYGGSKIGSNTHLAPLLDVVQRLHLTFSTGAFHFRLSGEYYRNELGNNTHLNTLLADATLIYKIGKCRLEAGVKNLFNKKQYAYTLYSATQSYTSRLSIRPREAMLKASVVY